jgi:hypothetical protein
LLHLRAHIDSAATTHQEVRSFSAETIAEDGLTVSQDKIQLASRIRGCQQTMLAAEAAAAGSHRQVYQRKRRTQGPTQISAMAATAMLVLVHLALS